MLSLPSNHRLGNNIQYNNNKNMIFGHFWFFWDFYCFRADGTRDENETRWAIVWIFAPATILVVCIWWRVWRRPRLRSAEGYFITLVLESGKGTNSRIIPYVPRIPLNKTIIIIKTADFNTDMNLILHTFTKFEG